MVLPQFETELRPPRRKDLRPTVQSAIVERSIKPMRKRTRLSRGKSGKECCVKRVQKDSVKYVLVVI